MSYFSSKKYIAMIFLIIITLFLWVFSANTYASYSQQDLVHALQKVVTERTPELRNTVVNRLYTIQEAKPWNTVIWQLIHILDVPILTCMQSDTSYYTWTKEYRNPKYIGKYNNKFTETDLSEIQRMTQELVWDKLNEYPSTSVIKFGRDKTWYAVVVEFPEWGWWLMHNWVVYPWSYTTAGVHDISLDGKQVFRYAKQKNKSYLFLNNTKIWSFTNDFEFIDNTPFYLKTIRYPSPQLDTNCIEELWDEIGGSAKSRVCTKSIGWEVEIHYGDSTYTHKWRLYDYNFHDGNIMLMVYHKSSLDDWTFSYYKNWELQWSLSDDSGLVTSTEMHAKYYQHRIDTYKNWDSIEILLDLHRTGVRFDFSKEDQDSVRKVIDDVRYIGESRVEFKSILSQHTPGTWFRCKIN